MISALSNALIVTAPTETAGGVVAAADAEKTARLNASLPSRLESIKAAAAKFLDEKQPLKERLNGFNEYRKAMNSIDDLVEAAGFGRRSRGLQQSDPIQAAHMKETAEIQARIYSSDLYLRQERIINASAIPAAKALAEDKHPAVGQLSHWDSLTVEEQDIAFEMYHGATFSDGSRAFSSKSQYRANLEGIIKDHDRNLADGMIGWPARAERLEQANRIMQTHAGDYKAWQDSRGNIGVVVDKIELSAEGAKAAAQTLSQAPPTEAEKTARLNADLSTRLDRIRSNAVNFLDEKIALKERLKGLSDFQAEAILIGKSFDSAGIPPGRGLDPNDQFQAGYMKEVLEISNQIWGSSLIQRASAIKGAGDFEAGKAVANGMSPGVGSLAHWDGLTSEEQDLVFALTNLTDRSGARRYSTKEQFRAEFARDVEEQQKLMAGPTVGGPSRAERLAIANDMMRHAAGDYKAWQASRGNIGVVVDKIDLSSEGAKAATKTLPKEAPADEALDAQLKALETLKQINAQQRDWLKSIEESDKDKVDRPDQPELPVQTLNPQPGSRLSVAA